jgi:hypothetical protein
MSIAAMAAAAAQKKAEEKDDAYSGGGGAVAQKKAEKAEEKGLDPTIMDLDRQRPSEIKKVEDGTPLNEDPKYEKYFKMLKMVSNII